MTRTVKGRVRLTSSPIPALVVVLLAGACTAGAAPDAPPPGAPQSVEALTAEGLPGTEWVLVRLNGAPPLPMPPVTLAFTDSTYGGYGGCNWFGGRYVAGADTLRTVGEISSTLRGCAGPIGDQEQRYVNTLRDVRGFRHAADTLRLHGADRRTVLELVRRRLRAMDPARLQGTRCWLQRSTRTPGLRRSSWRSRSPRRRSGTHRGPADQPPARCVGSTSPGPARS